MIERRIVAVTGPAGGGKTTLIECVLEVRNFDDLHCVRSQRLAGRRADATNRGDLKRYKTAGVARCSSFTWSDITPLDEFFETEPFLEVQDAILIEGDVPPGVYTDTKVFVFRPTRLKSLLRREPKRTKQQVAKAAMIYKKALSNDAALDRLIAAKFGELGRFLMATSEGRATARQALRDSGEPRFDPHDEKWALVPGLAGIVTAGVIVINVSSAAERKRAEAMRAEIERLRTDGAVFKDVMGVEGNRVPKTVVIADLCDPADPALKKAIRRVSKVLTKR